MFMVKNAFVGVVVVVGGGGGIQAVLKLEPDDRDEQYARGHMCRLR